MVKLEKILCPFDFSENPQVALQYAIHLMLKDDNATLYLTHVVDSRYLDYGGAVYGQEPSVRRRPSTNPLESN